jgi:type IV secretory pathway TrbD component
MRYLIAVVSVFVLAFFGYTLWSTVHTVVRVNDRVDQMMWRYGK